MRHRSHVFRALALALLALAAQPFAASAAGRLVIENAWIRTAPPTAPMRAGYATLRNAGDAALTVSGVSSTAFASVSIHTTLTEDGVARMRELPQITLAAGESVILEPGGKHLMLMQPGAELGAGAKAVLTFETSDGSSTAAEFSVRDAAADGAHDHHAH